MLEKEANPIKWANGVTPETANAGSLHKKRGRPIGWHTKWRPKEERELDRAWKELHKNQTPDVEAWPGPFQKRTDHPSVRSAYWMNCPVCNMLFLSNVSEAKTPNFSRVSGKRATARYCSLSCAGNSKAKPIFRVCAYCAKTFRIFQKNYNKRTCCNDCALMSQSGHRTAQMSMPLIAYAFEHGIEADRMNLVCEYCGVD
jgi:hypothetical protein